MTMHLEGPWLSTTGKRKGKTKFRNAEEARKSRELAEEWERNQAKWASMSPKVSVPKDHTWSYKLPVPVGRETQHIPSKSDTVLGAITIKQTPQYTGTKIIGIGTLHKSNAVPVFSDEEAKDISRMRRG